MDVGKNHKGGLCNGLLRFNGSMLSSPTQCLPQRLNNVPVWCTENGGVFCCNPALARGWLCPLVKKAASNHQRVTERSHRGHPASGEPQMLLAVGDVCLYSCSSHRPQVGRCGFGRRAIQHNKHLVLLALDEKIRYWAKTKKSSKQHVFTQSLYHQSVPFEQCGGLFGIGACGVECGFVVWLK